MNNKIEFAKWLNENARVSDSSIKKYTGAIISISKELMRKGILGNDLYCFNDPEEVKLYMQKYFSIEEFKEKDERGNRMYSNAFTHYIHFLQNNNTITELQKEEKYYNRKVLENLHNTSSRIENIIDEPRERPEFRIIHDTKIWKRNPKIASNCIIQANYLCEYDNNHKHFTSKYSNRNYVEAHHLIPMRYQDRFNMSLDTYSNLVSLCLVCHKKLHYAPLKEKIDIISTLYYMREKRLRKSKIVIDLEDLIRFYEY